MPTVHAHSTRHLRARPHLGGVVVDEDESNIKDTREEEEHGDEREQGLRRVRAAVVEKGVGDLGGVGGGRTASASKVVDAQMWMLPNPPPPSELR